MPAVHSSLLTVVDHPLVAVSLAVMRDRATPSPAFREAARAVSRSLAYEATRNLPTEPCEIETPLTRTRGRRLACRVIATPILRAGLGMLDAFLDVVPTASTGFLGLRRDEETLSPIEYYRNVPDTAGAHVFLLDPMLATGGSAVAALEAAACEHAASITLVAIICAPEGLERLAAAAPDVRVVTASVDERLNEVGYIVPGLGDAGDRLWGTL